LPHSDTNGSIPASRSPLHFAACRVLHRRQKPRHSPGALCLRTLVQSLDCLTLSSQSVKELGEPRRIHRVLAQCQHNGLLSRRPAGKSCIGSRKEVFQPHLPVRLPCYDLAPVTGFTLTPFLGGASGPPDSHGLTGGVYKVRERIHRAVADARLLAIPAS
jgi:hypothetical protein